MVKFDREIPGGQKGFIKLSIHLTPSFAGRTITKRALVITNDQNNRRFILRLKVAVEDPSSQAAVRSQ